MHFTTKCSCPKAMLSPLAEVDMVDNPIKENVVAKVVDIVAVAIKITEREKKLMAFRKTELVNLTNFNVIAATKLPILWVKGKA